MAALTVHCTLYSIHCALDTLETKAPNFRINQLNTDKEDGVDEEEKKRQGEREPMENRPAPSTEA